MRRWSWGRIVVGALLIVVGLGWLLQTSGVVNFPLRALTPVALIIIGIGLVIGSRHGSYPWLIVVGVILTLILAARPDDDGDRRFAFGDNVGDRIERPRDADDLQPYRSDAGELTIDLTSLEIEDRVYEVDARVDAGRLTVIVPEGLPIHVSASCGVGNMDILGEDATGFGLKHDLESAGYDDEAEPRFEINLRVGVGSIHVDEGEAVERPEMGRDRPRFRDRFREDASAT